MDVAHARSVLPQRFRLHIEAHRPARDTAALHALACWSLRYSPIAAPDTDGLLLDVSGMQRVHRSETELTRRVVSDLSTRGFAACVGIASSFAGAWAMARYSAARFSVIDAGQERDALTPLPVLALGVVPAIADALADVGVSTIGELLALPRDAVIARYGGALVERLDQALDSSVVAESIVPVQPKPALESELVFDGPTDHPESIHVATHRVLIRLVDLLIDAQRGARRLQVILRRPDADAEHIEVALTRPSYNTKHLWKLIATKLERVDLGAGVEGVRIIATRTARLRHEQQTSPTLGASALTADDAAKGELIDTLVGRLGASNVLRATLAASHLPERSFRFVPVTEDDPTPHENASDARGITPDRPTILYPKPELAKAIALTPDGPLLRLRWRNHEYSITHCLGPERLGAEWWRWQIATSSPSFPPERDYFAAQTDEGRWLFVARQPRTGRWFVHGEWA
jgi:protein ImuB